MSYVLDFIHILMDLQKFFLKSEKVLIAVFHVC